MNAICIGGPSAECLLAWTLQVMADSYGTVGKMCCHNERQLSALCSLLGTGPYSRNTTSLKLARIACAAHHGRVRVSLR